MVLVEEFLFLERDLTSKASVRGCSCVAEHVFGMCQSLGSISSTKEQETRETWLEAPVLQTCPPSSYKLKGLSLL